jgi:hypothetical protein
MQIILFFSVGLLGMALHYLKKWGRGEIECSIFEYIMSYKKHTIAAVCTMIGLVVPIFMASPELSQLSLSAAFLAGFTADSAMNKGE